MVKGKREVSEVGKPQVPSFRWWRVKDSAQPPGGKVETRCTCGWWARSLVAGFVEGAFWILLLWREVCLGDVGWIACSNRVLCKWKSCVGLLPLVHESLEVAAEKGQLGVCGCRAGGRESVLGRLVWWRLLIVCPNIHCPLPAEEQKPGSPWAQSSRWRHSIC